MSHPDRNRRRHGASLLIATLLALGAHMPVAGADGPLALDLRRIVPITGDAKAGEAKAELCATCHGKHGIGIVPMFPNLAGQRPDYLYWELMSYKHGARPQSGMTPLVELLSEEDMRNFSMYYATMVPPPRAADADATPADPELLRLGEQIYMHGDAALGIPPCQGCHGADARGHPRALQVDSAGYTPFAVFPALRGQHAEFLQATLEEFRIGERSGSTVDRVMNGVGKQLDDRSISALTAWLASLDQVSSR
ncbi:MAG TPA: c-type cytochrome [Steroidobacteraceae bacterium]|nr:c-type cytochrome [Steroidobacteraceae bacterium]HNS27707.1 c-type cytochrome [Steroidobacteraceae bacterium]